MNNNKVLIKISRALEEGEEEEEEGEGEGEVLLYDEN